EVAPGVLSVVRFERPLENVGRSPLTLSFPREERGSPAAAGKKNSETKSRTEDENQNEDEVGAGKQVTPALTEDQQRRLALAKWIANHNNPLPARVMVNRSWQHHFGEGIVGTPSD